MNDARPYFYLSYARSDRDGVDGDVIDRFVADLAAEARALTGADAPVYADFDAELCVGDRWPAPVEEALRTCQAFVPLLSPAYLTRSYCGKEWAVFRERVERHAPHAALIRPVLLHPPEVTFARAPAVVRELEYRSDSFPTDYLEHGLGGLRRFGANAAYRAFVADFANALLDAVRTDPLPPADRIPSLADVQPAFPASAAAEPQHLFISYSRDRSEFALRLADALESGPTPFRPWLDLREMQPGQDWDRQLVEAIRTCRGLLFVLSRDSVEDASPTKAEWVAALRYKKPVIPLRVDTDAELPFGLSARQFVDFTEGFDTAMNQLQQYLRWIDTPTGVLQELQSRLADAELDLPRADAATRRRIEHEIEQLESAIDEQRRRVEDPSAAGEETERRIATALERERRPEPTATPEAAVRIVNRPPMAVPDHFQDRHVETELLGDFLRDESTRLMSVIGRGGTGKTALVCRVLKALETGSLPDSLGELRVDGIVYLRPANPQVNLPNLLTALSRLLPADKQLLERLADTGETPTTLTHALLGALRPGRIVVLLDSFEDLIDVESFGLVDEALDEALRALLTAPAHGVKVILTSRVPPRSLMLVQPGAQARLNLDDGLGFHYAEEYLRALDADGRLGIKDAPESLLADVVNRTRGMPRALEALAALLAADRFTSLPELLTATEGLPENVVEVLVGEAFSRLDPVAQQVMEALAIYGSPVPPVALDYLLQPYQPAIDSAVTLSRLVNMQFVRRDAGRYFLHPVDRDYVLDRVPVGDPSDRDAQPPPFSQAALRGRAVGYFAQISLPPESATSIDDLSPQLARIEQLRAVGDHDAAAETLLQLDDRLLFLGAASLVADEHELLQGRLTRTDLREASLGALRRARRMLRPAAPETGGAPIELGHTLRGHTAPVTRLAWLPDGKTLVSASLDGTLRAWNVATGVETLLLRGHEDRVLGVAVTRDGELAVSASADLTLKVWDLSTGEELRTLAGHRDLVAAVATTADGRTVVSGSWDRTLKVWDLETGDERRTLRGHTDRINAVTVTDDGRTAISAAWDGSVRVWDLGTGDEVRVLEGGTGGDNDLALIPHSNCVASAAEDGTVRIWELETGRQHRVLEGPSAYVTGTSVSVDGRLLAAKSADGAVRVWRTDTWAAIHKIDEGPPRDAAFAGIAFSPTSDLLATLGEDDSIVRIWQYDGEQLIDAGEGDAVRYATAKLVLVGDRGVGKTGLGWRLAHGTFKVLPSTHGQQFWLVDKWHVRRPDGTDCDVVLWDFAGQADYRLIHTLFLDDIDLALVVFDPSVADPLGPVEYWTRHLVTADRATPAILVAARIDVGPPTWAPEEFTAWGVQHGISGGYAATSAVRGDGIDSLTTLIQEQVAWDDKTPTVSPRIFYAIKDIVLRLREGTENDDGSGHDVAASRLLTPEDLSRALVARDAVPERELSFESMMTAVRHLGKHGYVAVLEQADGEQVILLRPHVINNLASSMVLEARRSNLGVLDEARFLAGDYPFPELDGFSPQEQATLLEAAAELSLKHHLCFREALPDGTALVFPSLINQRPPPLVDVDKVGGMSYVVTGAIETLYPSLVVQLGHTNVFARASHWSNRAQYEVRPAGVCGFEQIESHAGTTEFVIYFGADTPQSVRTLFQGLFESYLEAHDVRITRQAPVVCPACGYPQNRAEVRNRIQQGMNVIGCANACGAVIRIGAETPPVELTPHEEQQISAERTVSRVRTAFDTGLTRFKAIALARPAYAPPTCFMSYAWGDPADDGWVLQFAEDLEHAGIRIVLDEWDSPVGGSLVEFIEQLPGCDFAAVIGTPLYRQKAENADAEDEDSKGHVLAVEARLISERLTIGSRKQRHSVLPVLRSGTIEESFTPMLHGITAVDLRDDDDYFDELLKLIGRMHGLSSRDESVLALQKSVREAMPRAGSVSRA